MNAVMLENFDLGQLCLLLLLLSCGFFYCGKTVKTQYLFTTCVKNLNKHVFDCTVSTIVQLVQ